MACTIAVKSMSSPVTGFGTCGTRRIRSCIALSVLPESTLLMSPVVNSMSYRVAPGTPRLLYGSG
jgi:hypothetical protein